MSKFKGIKSFFNKIKWFFTEISKMYSSENSFFSKKRVESGIAFLLGQIGMVFYLYEKIGVMDMYDMSMWAGIEFLIAGYTLREIQKEKKNTSEQKPNDSGPKILND